MKSNALVTLQNNASQFFGKTGLKVREHSPEILMVSGVCSIIVGVVLACRATLKAEEILAEHEEMMDTIDEAKEKAETGVVTYTDEMASRDKVAAYAKTVGKFAIHYGPAVICLSAGIVAICASHGIMKKRNAALMAAYQAVDLAFRQYRDRVVNEEGSLKDQHYLTGAEYKVKELENDVKKIVESKEPDKPNSQSYDKFFDETSSYWKKDSDANLRFLLIVQNQLNNKLRTRGYVFLNEVYAALDIPPTPAGQIVGWANTESSFIDLGIFDVSDEQKRRFVNGYERSIRIHPNVQGIIYDLI